MRPFAAMRGRIESVLPCDVATLDPETSSVEAGAQSALTVTLSRPAAYPGVIVGLSNTSTGQVVQPAAVTMPAGKLVVSTTVNTAAVPARPATWPGAPARLLSRVPCL